MTTWCRHMADSHSLLSPWLLPVVILQGRHHRSNGMIRGWTWSTSLQRWRQLPRHALSTPACTLQRSHCLLSTQSLNYTDDSKGPQLTLSRLRHMGAKFVAHCLTFA